MSVKDQKYSDQPVTNLILEDRLIRLEREAKAYMITIERLSKELSDKNQKLKHLEDLLSKTAPLINPPTVSKVKTKISSEESIAEVQLERLRQVSEQRSLTLEETRTFDLLVKNKRLSQDESTVNLQKGGYREVSDIELIKIAEKSNDFDKG